MYLNAFKEFLIERNLDKEKIENSLLIVSKFNTFILKQNKSLNSITETDFQAFSENMILDNENTFENYFALLRFGYFLKNNILIVGNMEILDGREILPNFSRRLIEEYNENIRNEIFEDKEVPPLGLNAKKKVKITKQLVDRTIKIFGETKSKDFFSKGLRDKYTDSYKEPRERLLKLGNIDKFLKGEHQRLISNLEKHMNEDSLFFTQKINNQVIEHVKKDPSIESGIRDGNIVLITKIPYQTISYLEETDERKKRYYYCHCPVIREALLEEDKPISPIFCNSSGGYYKNYWEAVLGHSVKIELLESVINGDKVCKFALNLSEKEINSDII